MRLASGLCNPEAFLFQNSMCHNMRQNILFIRMSVLENKMRQGHNGHE